MGLLEKIAAARRKSFVQPPFWAYDGLGPDFWASTSLTRGQERIENSFEGYVQQAYKASGIIFACLRARQMIFSEARFQWRTFLDGRPGELFGSPELALLENPWPGGTTGELLARMEVTASLAGAYYGTTADDRGRLGRSARGPNRRIVHMRPDWTTLVIDSPSGDPNALDANLVAFSFQPPPTTGVSRPEPVILLPDEVVFYSPMPDPLARFRGTSWIASVVEEIRADKAATAHKGKFFDNGGTLGPTVTLDKDVSPANFAAFVERFKAMHRGLDKAYEFTFLGGGASLANSMADFKQMEFTALQGRAETRIASVAGVHPTLVGFSEGLQGSSLNAGNFQAAARLTANITMRPLWRIAAASLQTLVGFPRFPNGQPNTGASLWYDDRDIAFLHEDASDLAQIRSLDAQTLRTLVDGGYDPDAAVDFVSTNDLTRLKGSHSGLLPVQLQPPGSGEGATSPNGSRTNGRQPAAVGA